MKIKLVIISILLLKGICIHSQNSGYLGQKNIVEINTSLNTPFIANLFNFADKQDNNPERIKSLDDKRDILDFGYGISYFRILSRSFAIGLFIGQDHFSALPESIIRYDKDLSGYISNEEYFGETDFFDFTTFTVMPKIEFSKNSTIIPVGFSHQIGFGIRSISLNEKKYEAELTKYPEDGFYTNYTLSPISSAAKTEFETNFYDYSKNKFKAKTFMYALNMRTPISNHLLINYGFQYTFNFMPKLMNSNSSYQDNSAEKYWYTNAEINDMIRKRKQFSFILFSLGLSYSF